MGTAAFRARKRREFNRSCNESAMEECDLTQESDSDDSDLHVTELFLCCLMKI